MTNYYMRISYILNICIWLIILSMVSITAEAQLDLWVIRPAEEFVTNNRELIIEGIVKHTENNLVSISTNAPAGVSDLGSLEESIQTLVVDLGGTHSLTTLVLSPVFEDELALGPRVVNLSFSENGQSYTDRGIFNCSSGMNQENGKALAEFGAEIRARYVQIDMLDGWQASRIGIDAVGFLNTSGELLNARIRGVSLSLDLDESGEAYFQIAILLREGENQISIAARTLDSIAEIEEKFELVTAIYMPEVVVDEEPLTLSDGYRAELVIPPSALGDKIKKINIRSLEANQIEWTSYSDNTRIERGTYPVLAYEIGVSAISPFPSTAKDSLERQPPSLAVDGNTAYPSTWMTTLSALPVWLKVDLREPRSIGKVVVIARKEDDISYGPERLIILTSNDDINYDEIVERDECNDTKTEIDLLTAQTAQYVQISIEDGKQGNNIQINEVEFYDDEGERIVSYVQLGTAMLARPAELTLFYDDSDLSDSGIQREESLAIFSWNEGMQEWTMVGGDVDTSNNWITVNLNHLSTFAIFEASSPVDEVRWSYNPFSPNGDGIADTTTLFINLSDEIGGQARVELFDHTGRLVRTLMHEDLGIGHMSIVWDGKDENGDMVSIGPYIYQVQIGSNVRNGLLVVAR